MLVAMLLAVPSHDWGPVSHSYFLVATCTGSFRDSQWRPPSFHPSLMYVMHFPTSLLFLPLSLCLAGPLLLIAIFPGVSLPTHVVLLVGILTRRLQPSYLSESLWPVGTHTLSAAGGQATCPNCSLWSSTALPPSSNFGVTYISIPVLFHP